MCLTLAPSARSQELLNTRKEKLDELDRARRTLQHSMSRQQWEAIAAVKRIAAEKNLKGVFGSLIELFTVKPEFVAAVEAAAGNQLFQVVVDTDETAQVLVKELQKQNAGRVTFMPLNRLTRKGDKEPNYPTNEDDAISMLSRLSFHPKVKPAMVSVFRKALIVRTLELGTRFAKSHELDCVTIGGDQVSRKGAMTGGYVEERRSRIGAQADILRLEAELADLDVEAAEVAKGLVAVDQKVTSLIGELQKEELAAQKALQAAEMEALELSTAQAGSGGAGGSRAANAHKAADAQKEKAHAALLAAAKADRDRLAAVEAEMASAFTSDLSSAERAELASLHERLRELRKSRDAASSEASQAEAAAKSLRYDLDEHLRKRQDELRHSIAELGDSAGHMPRDAEARLAEAREKLAGAEAALAEAAEQREEKRSAERALQATADELKGKLSGEQQRQADADKLLDRLLSRRNVLLQKVDEFTALIRKLGAIPQDGLDGVHAGSSSAALHKEIEKVTAELGKLAHVNKKALDQHTSFSEERNRLIEKQQEMEEAREKIEELIEHLDNKKDEALEVSFRSIQKMFALVFKELIPEGSGSLKLILKHTLDAGADARTRVANFVGVGIRVKFPGGSEATSMSQLSGGQKTMVALCLIFAIQRCDPAPFYIFDEIDAALDASHRAALAKMVQRQASKVDDDGNAKEPTQFITTTFRPELIRASDKCYGVTHARKASTIRAIAEEEALRIIAEDTSRQRQHIGVA